MSNVIEAEEGKCKLTSLGREIMDPDKARQAKAKAFLNVPLFKAVYEKYKGSVLPPAAALERDMLRRPQPRFLVSPVGFAPSVLCREARLNAIKGTGPRIVTRPYVEPCVVVAAAILPVVARLIVFVATIVISPPVVSRPVVLRMGSRADHGNTAGN
jgi:hypothetical protein